MPRIKFVSASKLVGDAQCPYRQKHEKFTESDATRFGKAVDAGICAWLKDGDFQTVFAETAGKNGLPLNDYRDRGLKCFETLLGADWLNLDRDQIIAVQSEDGEATYYGNKFFELVVGPTWGLRGAMDLVDFYVNDDGQTILRIIDWKTGFSEADDLQLACYALAAWKKYSDFIPWDKIETRFFYLDQGGKGSATFWNKETLVSAYKYIESKVKTFLGRKEWPKTVNKNCHYCEFKDDCEAYTEALTEKPAVLKIPTDIEHLPQIVEKLEQIEIIRKLASKAEDALKKARNKLLLDNGPAIIGDHEYKAKEQTQNYNYELDKIFAQTEELIGRPPFEIFKFDSAAFNKLVANADNAVTKKALKQLLKDSREVNATCIKVTKKVAPKKITAEVAPAGDVEDAVITEEAK